MGTFRNNLVLILEDFHLNRVALAQYQLYQTTHGSMIFCKYLYNEVTGEYITTDWFSNRKFVNLEWFYKEQYSLDLYFLEFLTDKGTIVIELSLREYLQINTKGSYTNSKEHNYIHITITPGHDQIIGKQIRTYIIKDQTFQSFQLVLDVRPSGMIVKTISPRKQSIYLTHQNIQINLNQLFSGDFLHFKIECEIPNICSNDPNNIAAITYTPPSSISQSDVSSQLNSISISSIFVWNKIVMAVDKDEGFVQLTQFDDDYSLKYPLSEWLQNNYNLVLSCEQYGIKNISYVLSLQDQQQFPPNFSVWLVQAEQKRTGLRQLLVFSVEVHAVSKEIIKNITKMKTVTPSFQISFAKYSSTWHRLVVVTKGWMNLDSQVYVFQIKYVHGDDVAQKVSYSIATIINAKSTKIAPFYVQSFEIHDFLPLIIFGINGYGALVMNIYTFEIIFIFDLRGYIQQNFVIDLSIKINTLQITGVILLGEHSIGLIVNYIGMVFIKIKYDFDIKLNEFNFVIFPEDDIRQYISGPYISQSSNPVDSPFYNWIQIKFKQLYLNSQHIYQDVTNMKSRHLFGAWLSYKNNTAEWFINVFNDFNDMYSKQYQSVKITNDKICTQLELNPAEIKNYPKRVSFLVFCKNALNQGEVFDIDIDLSATAKVDIQQLKRIVGIETSVIVGVTASNNNTASTAYSSVTIILNSANIEILTQIIGFLSVLILVFVLTLLYKSVQYFRHYKQRKMEKMLNKQWKEFQKSQIENESRLINQCNSEKISNSHRTTYIRSDRMKIQSIKLGQQYQQQIQLQEKKVQGIGSRDSKKFQIEE